MKRLWYRLLCRLLGHRLIEVTSYDPKGTRVGVGCSRPGCQHGTVRAHRASQYPRPKDPVRVERKPRLTRTSTHV